jgi:asparagine synthase (glutamine-hydrolysing)
MCGIAGYFNTFHLHANDLKRLTDVIKHRGPDGEGFYIDEAMGVGLGHRRLAILDLSELGKQPMTYADSDYWITYNGEIYNYVELREDLKQLGYIFHSNTDTEVLLAAYCAWGIESFKKLNGMFAFAIYDKRQNNLLICRDNYGIKPLYYYYNGKSLVFGSELKVFAVIKDRLGLEWDERSIKTILTSPYILESTENSLFKQVKRLLPGHCLKVDNYHFELNEWWITKENLVQVPRSFSDQRGSFRELFFDACRIRMRSHVPVGACLSGGIDSGSMVSALSQMGFPIKPFIHTFQDSNIDETKEANLVVTAAKLKPTYVFTDRPSELKEIDRFICSAEATQTRLKP